MKYRDLIQFEAVTEVIQLVTANKKETAAQLVDTYVISDRMADVILHQILPDLKIGKEKNGRGLFIVGNYGTGKSHLMSVLTAVAEHTDLADHIKHTAVRDELKTIAGKFKVSRQETTALDVPLRDIVFNQLEVHLQAMGVDHHFPGNKEPVTNKQALEEMMRKFQQIYPEHGLMVALDELLDFLRAKDQKSMIMDLNFLREVGETCETMPLRFMAGIQEALFDNPRFQFIADTILRVRSRYDQASIVRQDIAYVVSHRLLQKTESQKKTIRKHLEKFTPLYAEMAERLDQFEELFPVHPAYLEVFEQVTIGERRDLLKALSQEMEKLLDNELPTEEPGLITFDSYWRMISADNAFRALPDVRIVLEKAQVLSDKVRHAPETKDFREAALRIIDGLALHRLTVTDIYAPIGITALELRDRLCIHLPLPEQDTDFLLATIETIIKAISTAVNGQFISHNKENDQYYLDLKKDIDYDALIQQKASVLDPSMLDVYFFNILINGLEIRTDSYVPGFRIWETEIPFSGHGITRKGYIFLGSSNERSTAHPERDFYIYFQGLRTNGHEKIVPKADEVYFELFSEEKSFRETLLTFAGASEMSAISSGSNKDQYELKLRQARGALILWLRENFIRCFKVRQLQNEATIPEAISKFKVSLREMAFRDQVYALSSAMLKEAFEASFPGYPSFQGIEITGATLPSAADAALKATGGGPTIRLAQIVLEGLELGNETNLGFSWTVENSRYARYFQDLIKELPAGKVINRADLVAGEPGAERDKKFNLEPELLIVVLAAMMRQGILSISMQGMAVSDADLAGGTRLSLDQLLRFTSISRPNAIPEHAVKELFTQFGIDPAMLSKPDALPLAVSQLQQNIQTELNGVVKMSDSLREGPRFWGEMVLPAAEQQASRKDLEDYRKFLTGLQSFSNVAKLANLSEGVGEIKAAVKTRKRVEDIQRIFDILHELDGVWSYLLAAQPLLSEKDDWQRELRKTVEHVRADLADAEKRASPQLSAKLRGALENVQSSFTARYLELHNQQRLDRVQDEKKSKLAADPRWSRMRTLSKISLLPSRQLDELQKRLGEVESCPNLQPGELKNHTACPHCGFNPAALPPGRSHASARLDTLEGEFSALCKNWVEVLLENLQTEDAARNLGLVEAGEREAVQDFLRNRALPEPLTERFLNGVENTLQGLEVITIEGADYLLALTQPGMPCTPDELEKRIREFLQKQLEGKDRRKVRIQINW